MISNYKDDKYNIVFFWKQNDTGIYGRRQDMLIKYLSQSPEVNRIVHFDAPMEVGTLVLQLYRGKRRKASEAKLVFLQTVSRILGLKRSPKIKYYTFLYSSKKPNRLIARWLLPKQEDYIDHIKTVLERNKVWERRTIFWVCPKNFDFPKIVSALKHELILADIIDDHRGWYEQGSPEAAEITANYKDILGLSDIVITNCKSISDSMSIYSDNIYVVPNACELPGPNDIHNDMPGDLRKIGRPIIGYVGNLSSRIDIPLLEYVAAKRPHWNIVLIGSADQSEEILRLNTYPNIHFLGIKKYSIVRRYISNFDVAIIPHINNELTRSMNPLKMFVYCSLNVPVVSTEIQNLDELIDLVHVARERDEFIEKIELALAEEKSKCLSGEQIYLLRKNSWEERAAQVLSLIKEKIG